MADTLRARLARFFNPPTEGCRAPRRLFWVALFLRLAYMTLAHTYRVRSWDGNFNFGFEAGRIAKALVTGYGYADPFANAIVQHTGPTAWLPPLYPLVMAAAFKLFGVYTPLAAWFILAFNCICSASVALAVWELGFRFAGRRNALWAGWIWVLYPAALQYAVKWIWETSLTTALLAGVLVLAFRMRAGSDQPPDPEGRRRQWALFGLAWGLIALSNSSLLLFLPAAGLWIVWGARARWRSELLPASLAALIFFVVLVPWTLRNYTVFHALVPLRNNFGAELYLANGPDSNGIIMEYDQPSQNPLQLRIYKKMGEFAYCRARGSAARAYIAAHPAHFLTITARRIYFFWASLPQPVAKHFGEDTIRVLNYGFISLAGLLGLALALRNRQPGVWLFFWAMLLIPCAYYIISAPARFRHPLEPILCVLGVYLFQAAEPRGRRTAAHAQSGVQSSQ